MKNILILNFCLLSLFIRCQNSPILPEANLTPMVSDSLPDSTAISKAKDSVEEALPKGIQRLLQAYPDHFKGATANALIWKDGTEMPYSDGRDNKTFAQLLNESDLEDQVMSMPYPKGKEAAKPQPKEDPGRVRYEPFFKKMYGDSEAEVRRRLTTIVWLPKTMGVQLQVTTVNGIDKKMQAISNRLDTMPHLHKYLANPGGTFNWRNIAGTNRLRLHSFGMTIDVNVAYSDYWRWAVKSEDEDGARVIEYKNRIPLELVEIFEAYGFIWGGKWYHYDTMHFEYRPELLID